MKAPSNKTTISRLAKRGSYDATVIHAILDEALYCTIAYSKDNQPYLIPNGFCRIGQKIYIHGSVGSHFLREIVSGIPVVIGVTLIDGLVLARSAFHHSMNYRSVVIFSRATVVEDTEEKERVLEAFTEKLVKGRWEDIRKPNAKELARTMVLSFDISEASAKIRAAGVADDEEDMNFPTWAGVVPYKLVPMTPEKDVNVSADIHFNYKL